MGYRIKTFQGHLSETTLFRLYKTSWLCSELLGTFSTKKDAEEAMDTDVGFIPSTWYYNKNGGHYE